MTYSDIITMEPGKRGGKPCVRGLRITVYNVMERLASGMTHPKRALLSGEGFNGPYCQLQRLGTILLLLDEPFDDRDGRKEEVLDFLGGTVGTRSQMNLGG